MPHVTLILRRCSQTAGRHSGSRVRLGRCLKLFISTESTYSHEFASQFGLAIFYTRKTPKTRGNRVTRASVYLNEPATGHCSPATRRKGGVICITFGRQRPIEQRQPERRRRCVRVRACVRAHACVRDVFAIYDNNILHRLTMIIIKISIIYYSYKSHVHTMMISPQRVAIANG